MSSRSQDGLEADPGPGPARAGLFTICLVINLLLCRYFPHLLSSLLAHVSEAEDGKALEIPQVIPVCVLCSLAAVLPIQAACLLGTDRSPMLSASEGCHLPL